MYKEKNLIIPDYLKFSASYTGKSITEKTIVDHWRDGLHIF